MTSPLAKGAGGVTTHASDTANVFRKWALRGDARPVENPFKALYSVAAETTPPDPPFARGAIYSLIHV